MRLTTIYITIYLFIIINCATQFEEKYTKKPKTLEAPTTEKGMDNDLSKTEAQNLWDKLCMSKVDQTQRNAFLAQNLHKISETQLWDLAAADINDLPATAYKELNEKKAQDLWRLINTKFSVNQTQRNAFLAQNLHKISETQLWDLAAADINDLPATVYKNLNDDLKFGWLKNTHLTNEQKKMLSKLSDYKPAR